MRSLGMDRLLGAAVAEVAAAPVTEAAAMATVVAGGGAQEVPAVEGLVNMTHGHS